MVKNINTAEKTFNKTYKTACKDFVDFVNSHDAKIKTVQQYNFGTLPHKYEFQGMKDILTLYLVDLKKIGNKITDPQVAINATEVLGKWINNFGKFKANFSPVKAVGILLFTTLGAYLGSKASES